METVPANIEMEEVATWYNQLTGAQRLSAVVSLCMEIFVQSGKNARAISTVPHDGNPAQQDDGSQHRHDSTRDKLLESLCALMWADDLPHTHRKHISKACFSLCRDLLEYVNHIDHRFAKNIIENAQNTEYVLENESIMLYGMIHSTFFKQFHPTFDNVQDDLPRLFQASSIGYNRWFYTVAECALTVHEQMADVPGWNVLLESRIWMETLVNLESPYRGVRELMLRLLNSLVQNTQFAVDTVLRTLERWDWHNRNKYHLLALLLRMYRTDNVLQRTVLSFGELENVLVQSLRYKHLLSGGQAMLRVMPSENVHRLVVKVLHAEGDSGLVRNMVKYWFTTLPAKCHSAIFDLLELNELTADEHSLPNYLREEKCERLFLLVNLFKRDFQKKSTALEQLLRMLCRLADSLKPISAFSLGLLIKTLTYHIIGFRGEPAGRFLVLTDLLRLLLEAIEMPGSTALCGIVVEQCRLLLEKCISSTDERWGVVPRLLHDMHGRYLRLETGRESVPYQQTITALRLFALLIKQCFEFPPANPYRLTPRPPASVPWIVALRPGSAEPHAQQLADLHADAFALTHQLRSEYDDVRIAVARLLYNQPTAFCFDAGLLANVALIQAHLFLPLLASMERELIVAIAAVRRDLFASALRADDDQQADELQLHRLADQARQVCLGVPGLHRVVERASQVCFGVPGLLDDDRSIDPLLKVTRNVASVVETVLSLLNVARPAASSETHPHSQLTAGTSFEIMECSMQQLLERSPEWAGLLEIRGPSGPTSVDVTLAKRVMQVALWKALRAVAVFTEKYAIWLLDNSDRCPDKFVRELRGCMKLFGNVLLNCCHRGAIESSASCLGRVVRRIMQDKAQRSRRLLQPAGPPGEVPADVYVDQLFLETLAVESAQGSDFRRARGYLFLLHSIMQAEAEEGIVSETSLLQRYLQRHVVLYKRARAPADNDSELPPIGVLQLHQLNMLVKAAAMNEVMLPYVDQLMIVALEAFRRPHWPVRNAALQLYTSCTMKLAGQQQQYVDAQCDWPPVYVSLDEVVFKLPRTVHYLQQQLQTATDGDQACSTAFLLLLFEFFTRFEYRTYGLEGPTASIAAFRDAVWQLVGHEHDQVRRQAARCYVLLTNLNLLDAGEDFRSTVAHLLTCFFVSSPLPNRQHGLCATLFFYVRRYVTLHHFAQPRFAREQETLAPVRRLVAQHAPSDGTERPVSFRCRITLLHFLVYIGFDRSDPTVLRLLRPYATPDSPNYGHESFIMAWDRATAGSTDGCDPSGMMPYEIEIEIEMDREPEEDD